MLSSILQFSAFKVTLSYLLKAHIVIPILDWFKFIKQEANFMGIGQNHKKYLSVFQKVLKDLNANNAKRTTIF